MANYWRSLEELHDKPSFQEYLHREFPEAASLVPDGVSRRRWLQVMGASLTLAGVTGCHWEDENVGTYANRPANRIPGVPVKYATLLERSGVAIGVLATSYDGRPIKVDNNPDHPQGFSGTDAFTQASVLQLYDPDRIARNPADGILEQLYDPNQNAVLRKRTKGKTSAQDWQQFEKFAASWLKAVSANGGQGVRVLCGASSSPSLHRMKAELAKKLPKSKWVEFEPISRDRELLGTELATGNRVRVRYHLDQAKVIVGLDSDLFDYHPEAMRHVKQWSNSRVPELGDMNRTYAVESCYTRLGQNADHRIPIASSRISAFLTELADKVQSALAGSLPSEGEAKGDTARQILDAMVDDLVKNQGSSLLVAGPSQPPEVHALCLQLNSLLGNLGKTVTAVSAPDTDRQTHAQAIQSLADEITAGTVETLIVLGGNPVYNTPSDINFEELMSKVPTTIRLGQYDDETSLASQWYVPETHDFEAWGDGRSWDGSLGIRQPLLSPLHKGVSDIELLAILLQQDERNGQQIVRKTTGILVKGLTNNVWQQAIHDGFFPKTALLTIKNLAITEDLSAKLAPWAEQVKSAKSDKSSLEVVYSLDDCVHDGRFANNAWLQELPASLTKLTWDNVATISPNTASQLNVKDGDQIQISQSSGTASLTVPVVQIPGQADGCLGITVGYGRTAAGHVGGSLVDDIEPVGTSAYQLITATSAGYDTAVKVVSLGKKQLLATTQDHWAIDVAGMQEIGKRVGSLVREGTAKEFKSTPDFAENRVHHPELESLWTEHEWSDEYQWGMGIDLARCVGCSACLTSCQSENNIPVVGRDQVSKNREMHWLRIDRYFVTSLKSEDSKTTEIDPINMGVSTQPVTCMHCENAPCEQVCPVAATMHSSEGLNEMVYNRCIGTRYCGNNCPYKVRRFNYFSNAKPLMKEEKELVQLVLNPEVTVRSRGVMEKCTYCVQRIQNGKITAKNERRMLADGEVKTACQEACPTDAISFGNLQDKQSQVSKDHANARSYAMLGELNVKPRTQYMARIRNPHPWLEAGYYLQPHEVHGHGSEGHHNGDDKNSEDHHGHDEEKSKAETK
ncbi:MAG: TAT-variant-translocated molybdopterin oxidoreductase [Planctomycetaceae bacterium]|nr:TAT-variant-translocated molybdopterin oxidoreductase [Planctomycetaceae bacterium]